MVDASVRQRVLTQLRRIGDDMSPEAMETVAQLYAPLHETKPYRGLRVSRGIPYGDHVRQRFDLFTSEGPSSDRKTILIFVHGGGYISGDRTLEWSAYYDNIGVWAARNGILGVTMSYRLAPEYPWPAGADDVKSIVDWFILRGDMHAGDPGRIVLMGHSSGATHIASYIARELACPAAAAILVSGTYDIGLSLSPNRVAYFGADEALYPERSTVAALTASSVPLLVSYAEYDSHRSHLQSGFLLNAMQRRRAVPSICLPGHTHWSQLFHINAAGVGDHYATMLLEFIENSTRDSFAMASPNPQS